MKVNTNPEVFCPSCHHPWFLHQAEGCQIRLVTEGQETYAYAPICGCTHKPGEDSDG